MEIVSKKPLKPGEKPSCHEIPPTATRGKPGPKGDAATIEVVGVYTIEPTDPARVENIGDENAAKLEFYIPKGDSGNVGPAGKDGADGKDYVLTEADKQEIADMIDVNVDGVVGGYYTPEVSQVDENTMKVSFTASGDKMPPVQSTEITLPAGRDGQDGAAGQDGYTPQKNVDYFDGQDGQDGVSPAVTVSDITGGHRITITDANGKKTIDVLDGKNGSDYVLTEADKQDIADMVDVQGSGVIAQPEQPTETGVLWLDTDDETNTELPTALPNPHALTFTGAAEGTYDGSAPLSVEIPAIGGEQLIYTEEQLATGTITADSSGQKLTGVFETGLTLGDLKQWKSFMCRIRGNVNADAGTFYMRLMNTNYGNDYNSISLFRSNQSGVLAVFEWANSEKTVLKLVSGYMGAQGNFSNVGSAFASTANNTWTIVNVSSSIGNWVDLRNCVDTQVIAVTKQPAATDYIWEIRGLVK